MEAVDMADAVLEGEPTVTVTLATPDRLKEGIEHLKATATEATTATKATGATTTVKIWPARPNGSLCFPEMQDLDFAIPALSDKAPLAVCISGGGFRATTLALGWLRALQHLGLLNKVRYLSVISGSSWLGAALSFQQKADVAEFLGPYLPPESCTLEALREVGEKGRSYARAVADAVPLATYLGATFVESVKKLAEMWHAGWVDSFKEIMGPSDEDKEEAARQWTRAMVRFFLEPFGLGEADGSTVTCSGTKGNVQVSDRADGAGRGIIYTANVEQLPFLIIGQAVMLPQSEAKYFPFEWTPLYSGCPVQYDSVSPKLGGGWVEALGINAKLVNKPDATSLGGAARHDVEVRPMGPASLGEAIGISSAYSSYDLDLGRNNAQKWAHKMLGFNTAKHFDFQEWETKSLQLTDGGAHDLFGLYPALRRQVPNVMVLVANGMRMEDEDSFARYMRELPALFGCAPVDADDKHGPPTAEYNKQHQVFKEGFKELYKALVAKKAAGEAAVHVAVYEVKENSFLGIKGGWKVRIMWVVNDRQASWEAQLPPDTRRKLDKERTSEEDTAKDDLNKFDAVTFHEFPLVDTRALDYTPELVNLMANHAAWMLVSNEGLVREMLEVMSPAAAAAATVTAAPVVVETVAVEAEAAAVAQAAAVAPVTVQAEAAAEPPQPAEAAVMDVAMEQAPPAAEVAAEEVAPEAVAVEAAIEATAEAAEMTVEVAEVQRVTSEPAAADAPAAVEPTSVETEAAGGASAVELPPAEMATDAPAVEPPAVPAAAEPTDETKAAEPAEETTTAAETAPIDNAGGGGADAQAAADGMAQ